MAEPRTGFRSRLRTTLRAVLPTDWLGRAGARFRHTLNVISAFTEEQVRPEERVKEAPELAWRAVQGLASDKHAKAALDYAKEESERIDIEQKRRVLPSKERQEKATADKLEAEARTARINEIRARIELIKELHAIGVLAVQDTDGSVRIIKAPPTFDWTGLVDSGILTGTERAILADIEDVLMPDIGATNAEITVVKVLKQPGDTVAQDEPLCEIVASSTDSAVPSPLAGTLIEMLVADGQRIQQRHIIARIRPSSTQRPE